MRITKSEYLYDVVTGPDSDLSLRLVELNPGLEATFPYLASLAQSFDNYQFNSLSFVFKSKVGEFGTTSNNALGTVMMYFEPDWDALNVATKQEFLAKQNVVNGQTTDNIVLRCPARSDLRSRFQIRVNGVVVGGTYNAHTESMIDYDIGRVFIGTQGCPIANQNIGELWVTYDVSLLQEDLVAADKNYLTQWGYGSFGHDATPIVSSVTQRGGNTYGPWFPDEKNALMNQPVVLGSAVADTVANGGYGAFTNAPAGNTGFVINFPNYNRTAYYLVTILDNYAAAPSVVYAKCLGKDSFVGSNTFPYDSALSIRRRVSSITDMTNNYNATLAAVTSFSAAAGSTLASFVVRCQGDRFKATSLFIGLTGTNAIADTLNNYGFAYYEIPESAALDFNNVPASAGTPLYFVKRTLWAAPADI